MVDTTDVQGYRTKYESQMDRLDDADIDERDREAIEKFVVHCRTNDSDITSLGTVVGHLNRLRLAAERVLGDDFNPLTIPAAVVITIRREWLHGFPWNFAEVRKPRRGGSDTSTLLWRSDPVRYYSRRTLIAPMFSVVFARPSGFFAHRSMRSHGS